MLCLLAAGIAVLGLSWFWYLRHFKIDLRPSFREVSTLAIDGLPYWTTGLVLNFYLWIDSLILSALAPLSAVGWYGVMTRLLGTLLFVPTILSTVYLPRFVRARTEGHKALGAEARPPLELVLVLALPIAAGATLVAPKLISDIYGPSFLPAIPVLVLLALCVPPIYLNIMANQVLIAANRQLDWTKVMVGAAIINPALNLVLIPYANSRWQNGAVGAAFALLVTEVGMSVVALAMMPRVLNGRSAVRVGKAFVATLLMGAVVFFARQHLGLMAQVVSGLATFGTLVVVLRVLSHDQALALLTAGRRLRLLRSLGGGRT
jgi:O-antigen/teichoic acid export membrane protein